MNINPLTCIDFYKADHRRQYPEGTEYVYSNFTPRHGLNKDDTYIIWFGLQYFIKEFLIETWNKEFFQKDEDTVVTAYKRRMDCALGKDAIDVQHIRDLHRLGYMPLRIKSLPEGSLVPLGVPVLTVINTLPKFFWLTNYIETVMSCYLWKMSTSATMAYKYKELFRKYKSDEAFIPFQAHDFSFRGMSSVQDAAMSGAGHLTSFCGTDTVPAIDLVEQYYGADVEKELVGCSVPATEHSVMCMNGEEGEFETFKRLITEVYPKGIVSIVSDTWNLWTVLTDYLPRLNDVIGQRDGKVIIRPDSGDPVKILCGDDSAPLGSPQRPGAAYWIDRLKNNKLGLIYGDSITLERAEQILTKLKYPVPVVFGIGSFTYQYTTRDVYGWAMKATWGQVNGKAREIAKDPITGKSKKSAKGLLAVSRDSARNYILYDRCTKLGESRGWLELVFEDGKLVKQTTLAEIRERINETTCD